MANDVLPSSLPPSSSAGGAPGNEAVLYITQAPVDPTLGATALNTDPAIGIDFTTTAAAVTASETPSTLTFTATTGRALKKGEMLSFGGVYLEVAADTPAGTTVQVTRVPVNIPGGSTISYYAWAKVSIRAGTLPSFFLQANFSTLNTDSGQIRLPSTPTVRDETIQSAASIDTPAQNALINAGLNKIAANKILGYCFFTPGVGSGRRVRTYGYMTVGDSTPDTQIDTVASWSHKVSALGAPVVFDKQPRAS